jgi:serine/threonine protein kinase/tetratricopeptide (TPR) repeat protein
MGCSQAVLVASFVNGALDAGKAREMRDHIEDCELCFLEVAAAAASISQEQPIAQSVGSSGAQLLSSGISWVAPQRAGTAGRIGAIPQSIGPYRIESVIGQGGMGVVYRGLGPDGGQSVAVKTVRMPTRALFESLRHEIQLLSRTHHPAIVRVLDFDLDGGDPWYAMEFIPGESLAMFTRSLWAGAEPLSRNGVEDAARERLPAANGRLAEVIALFQKLCEPLAFLHSTGIIHCDLKPSNIQLRGPCDPVLMDFGLVTYARGAVDREALSLVTGPRGTLSYVSPEVIRGHVPDPRADFYAIGCMLYETVTGRVPFAGSRDEIIQAHLNSVPPPASELVSDVPPRLDALLTKLLAKDLNHRLGHTADLERELAALAGAPSAENPQQYVFFRPQIVGRSADLAQVEACLDQLKNSHGALVFVSGESGIGKTFFAGELARRASLRRVRVIVGECEPPAPVAAGALEMSSSALSPLRRYFEFLRDSCREGGPDALERLLGGALPVLAPYSPALATLADHGSVPELSQLPQEAGRERLLTALTQTLAAAASQSPLMLVLDDLQWADELTLALFEKLRSSFAQLPLLVLATYRAEEETGAIRSLASQPGVMALKLGRLDRDAVSSMVSDLVGHREPERALVDFVFSHAEGVPFFTAEYLRSIWAEGVLRRREGGWRLSNEPSSGPIAALGSVPLPVRLAETIMRRLVGLSLETREALEAAAVLGREFELDALARILGVAKDVVHRRVHAALQSQIVLEVPGGESVRFAHDKFREAIYAAASTAQRRTLHGAAARALEGVGNQVELQYMFGEIARHFRLAGETAAAIDYLEKAGERALRISADAEALQFLLEALELERSSTLSVSTLRRAKWERGVAEALHGLGRLAQSTEPLARAAELLGFPFPKSPAAFGFGIVFQLARRVFAAARTETSEAQAETFLEMGRVLERILRISYYTGENMQLLYACVASLNFCGRAGPSVDLATAYINAGATASILPMHGLAMSYIQTAQALLEEHESPVVESQLRMVQGVYYMGIGDHAQAIERIQEGIVVANRIGFHRREDECTAVRSAIDIHAGRHGPVAERSARIEASARRRGDTQMISWALLQRMECLVMQGNLREACQHLEKLWPLLRSSERPEKIWILGFAAYARYRSGDRDSALAHADQAAALASESPPVHN